ncbi:MAG: hypothetical protein SGPRY_005062, partial [Prymnesium sp.]
FARHTALAAARPAGKVAGALSRRAEDVLVAMEMGSTPTTKAQSSGRMLLGGTAALGKGVISGAVGIVSKPYAGARQHGARGFAVGVGVGLLGAAIRPTAGIAKFAHSAADALQQATGEGESRATHSARVGRVRPPRMLQVRGERKRIVPFSLAEALARHVLESSAEGKYLHEPLLFCDLLGDEHRPETTTIVVLTGMRLKKP